MQIEEDNSATFTVATESAKRIELAYNLSGIQVEDIEASSTGTIDMAAGGITGTDGVPGNLTAYGNITPANIVDELAIMPCTDLPTCCVLAGHFPWNTQETRSAHPSVLWTSLQEAAAWTSPRNGTVDGVTGVTMPLTAEDAVWYPLLGL